MSRRYAALFKNGHVQRAYDEEAAGQMALAENGAPVYRDSDDQPWRSTRTDQSTDELVAQWAADAARPRKLPKL